jgi:hypothetical protein
MQSDNHSTTYARFLRFSYTALIELLKRPKDSATAGTEAHCQAPCVFLHPMIALLAPVGGASFPVVSLASIAQRRYISQEISLQIPYDDTLIICLGPSPGGS